LPDKDSRNYDAIKTAILSRYELTAAAYREKFRNSSQLSDESFKEFAVRLVDFLRHWLQKTSKTHLGLDLHEIWEALTSNWE
jgi:hypothetical protein